MTPDVAGSAPDSLAARLFGYGILYRARLSSEDAGAVCQPVPVEVDREARALAAQLSRHLGQPEEGTESRDPGEAAASVPFGRCGIDGRPREHVRLYHFERAFLDILTPDSARSVELAEGETALVEPGAVVRFRAWPRPGHRVLVAFQTEDRTPLHGHAAPLTPAGEAPAPDAETRLRQTSGAFQALWGEQQSGGGGEVSSRLERFFADMAAAIEGDESVAEARATAVRAGSFEAGGSDDLFAHARSLLTPGVLQRIRDRDGEVFRFPGMFGAVAPLFPLLTTG